MLVKFKILIFHILRNNNYKKALYHSSYRKHFNKNNIYKYKFKKINEIWEYAYINIEFYKEWKTKHTLPNYIDEVENLSSILKINYINNTLAKKSSTILMNHSKIKYIVNSIQIRNINMGIIA